jgi:lipoprotein NlpI
MRLTLPKAILCLSLVCGHALHAQTPTSPANTLPTFDPSPYQAQEKALSGVLEKMPPSQSLLSRRGDARVFLGDFKGAVADYEGMIALDPSQDAPHWRLGIAYYFAGSYEKAARQFEKYHAYDARDRENGVWKFFSQIRGENLEAARKGLLVYTQFDREPFPAVYKMLAGGLKPAEVLEEMTRKGLEGEPQVQFFAKYYAGLYEFSTGQKELGLQWVREAMAIFPPAAVDRGGPGYMWHAARLHAKQLADELAR